MSYHHKHMRDDERLKVHRRLTAGENSTTLSQEEFFCTDGTKKRFTSSSLRNISASIARKMSPTSMLSLELDIQEQPAVRHEQQKTPTRRPSRWGSEYRGPQDKLDFIPVSTMAERLNITPERLMARIYHAFEKEKIIRWIHRNGVKNVCVRDINKHCSISMMRFPSGRPRRKKR